MKTLLSILLVCVASLSLPAQKSTYTNAELQQLETHLSVTDNSNERLKLLLKLGSGYILRDTDKVAVEKGLSYSLSAVLLSKKSEDQESLADAYLLAGQFYKAQGDFKKAKEFGNRSLALFIKQNNQQQIGNAYMLQWRIGAKEDMDYAMRIPILEHALIAFHASGDKKQEGECYKEMGDLYMIEGEVMPAFIRLRKALELFTQIKYPHTEGVYDLLGMAYLRLGDYKAAVECGLKAVATAQQAGDTGIALATYYNRLGTTYSKIKDPVHAEQSFRNALEIDLRHNDTSGVFFIAYNIIIEMLGQGKAAEALHLINTLKLKYPTLEDQSIMGYGMIMTRIYTKLGRFKEGEIYSRRIEAIANERDVQDNILSVLYNSIIPFYIAGSNWKKAAALTARYRKNSELNNDADTWSHYYMLQSRIDSAQGNYLAAMDNYQKSIMLKDSLFNETKSHQINELNILYETEKKDKDLILMKRNADLQASHVKLANLQRNITLLVLALSGILLFVLLRSYKRKQKNTRVLEQKQCEIELKNSALEKMVDEKEWLVKEIHHRVKNNLHMVVGLLASQTEFLQGEEAMRAITESQNRVETMAIIHQRLYQTNDLSAIQMDSYIRDLADHLKYSGINNHILIQLDIAPVSFPLSHSVPIGLIVNEAVTNALKYAFRNDEHGLVNISLKAAEDQSFTLSIQDNGRGLPNDFDPDKSASFGTTLMKGLSSEINASFNMSSQQGTCISIHFVLPQTMEAIREEYTKDEWVH